MMVGRKIDFHLEKAPEHAGDAVLTLENVTLKSERNPNKNILNQVSFSVHKGEILCVARYRRQQGQSELVRVIVGLLNRTAARSCSTARMSAMPPSATAMCTVWPMCRRTATSTA